MREKGDFWSKFGISAKKCHFWHFSRPIKMEKRQISKIRLSQKFLNIPRTIYIHLQTNWVIFQRLVPTLLQSRGMLDRVRKNVKNTVFPGNNGDFLGDFSKIFRIYENHLITLYDQISGQLKRFQPQNGNFKVILGHFR